MRAGERQDGRTSDWSPRTRSVKLSLAAPELETPSPPQHPVSWKPCMPAAAPAAMTPHSPPLPAVVLVNASRES